MSDEKSTSFVRRTPLMCTTASGILRGTAIETVNGQSRDVRAYWHTFQPNMAKRPEPVNPGRPPLLD